MDRERIFEILRSGEFDQFIGMVEDDSFECKGEIYVLNTEANKREYVKDVSGLANSEGGIILVGAQTQRNATTLGDEIFRIRPFAQTLVNLDQHRDVLSSWTFPALMNVDMQWHPSHADKTVGILSIYVPVPDEGERPYLIIRTIEDGTRTTDIMIGYAERRRDSVHHRTIHDIHALIRRGQQYDTLSHRFDRMEDLLQDVLRFVPQQPQIGPQGMSDKEIAERIRNSTQEAGLEGRPSYSLFCYPVEPLQIPDLFADRRSEYVALLRNPPERRSRGFNLDTGEEPVVIRGNLWRAGRRGRRKTLELWRDGAIIFIASGGNDFLCWGRSFEDRSNSPINPFVLVETSYLFSELVRNIYRIARPQRVNLRMGISLSNFSGGAFRGYMLPYRPEIMAWEFGDNIRDAPDENFFRRFEVQTEISPERISFMLVSALYEWFGFSHDVIPFSAQADGKTIIDIDQIRQNA